MIDLLKFVLSDIWVFFGTIILIGSAAAGVATVVRAFRPGFE